MLVLSRKPGEKILLSNGVVISIEGLEHGRVKIGIEAPLEIGVKRSSPCRCCGRPTFEYYLGYPDIPFCGRVQCEQWLNNTDKSLFR